METVAGKPDACSSFYIFLCGLGDLGANPCCRSSTLTAGEWMRILGAYKMKPALPAIRKVVLRLTNALLPASLCLLVAIALIAQFLLESVSWTEVLPLTSFVVLLTFSGLAFNWSRGPIPLETAAPVHRSGIDLFLASLLALVSAFLAWLPSTPQLANSFLLRPLFVLHWFFLLLAALLFLVAVLGLLAAARRGGD